MRIPSALQLKKLFLAAKKARTRAHAPYSGHSIGAALLTRDGKIISGCNIENASYGGTVCAERVAIWKAVSEGSKVPIQDICVISHQQDPWPPCGLCRQVISEFANAETRVHIANMKGIKKTMTFGELFPDAFTPHHLKK